MPLPKRIGTCRVIRSSGLSARHRWTFRLDNFTQFLQMEALDMTPALPFNGIYTPVVTPFRADHSIDWDALGDVIDNLLDKGVHGLISGGSTGENYAQTVAERIEIAHFTHARNKGRAQMIVGTGAMLTGDSIALAEAARDMKADAILLASPPYAVPTERENALNALAIDKAAGLPVMLYNYPGRTGTMMGDEFLDRVGRSRNFCGIKESSGRKFEPPHTQNGAPQAKNSSA